MQTGCCLRTSEVRGGRTYRTSCLNGDRIYRRPVIELTKINDVRKLVNLIHENIITVAMAVCLAHICVPEY